MSWYGGFETSNNKKKKDKSINPLMNVDFKVSKRPSTESQFVANPYDRGQYWDKPGEVQDWGESLLKGFNIDKYHYAHKEIDEISQVLNQSGIEIREPDQKGKLEEKKKRSKLEKYLFDPVNSLQYALTSGLKNISDDDDDTKFFEGIKSGFKAGFSDDYKDYRTGYSDVLTALISSNDEAKKQLGTEMLAPFKALSSGISKVTGKDLGDDFHTDRAIKWAGLVGDIFLDPSALIGGVKTSAEALLKGRKALGAVDTIGDSNKAMEVLEGLGRPATSEDAKYLFEKTAKQLGFLDGTDGLTFAGKTVIKPETLAKVGDYTGLSTIGKILFAPIDKLKETKVVEGIADLFVGGARQDWLKAAKADPENAMELIAFADMLPKRRARMAKNIEDTVKKVEEMQKKIGGVAGDELIQRTLEQPDKVEDIKKIVKTVTENPKYEKLLKEKRQMLAEVLNMSGGHLDELKEQLKIIEPGIEYARKIKEYKDYLRFLESVPEIESLQFAAHLMNNGLDDKFISKLGDKLIDPLEFATKSIDDVIVDLSVSEDVAIKIKGAADNAIDTLTKTYPDLAQFYSGTKRITGEAFAESGLRGVKGFATEGSESLEELITSKAKELNYNLPERFNELTQSEKLDLLESLDVIQKQQPKSASEESIEYARQLLNRFEQPWANPDLDLTETSTMKNLDEMSQKEISDLIDKLKDATKRKKEDYKLDMQVDNPLRQIGREDGTRVSSVSASKDKVLYSRTEEADEIEQILKNLGKAGVDEAEYDTDVLERIFNRKASHEEVQEELKRLRDVAREYGVSTAERLAPSEEKFATYINMLNQLDNETKLDFIAKYPVKQVKTDGDTYYDASQELFHILKGTKPEQKKIVKTSGEVIQDILDEGAESANKMPIDSNTPIDDIVDDIFSGKPKNPIEEVVEQSPKKTVEKFSNVYDRGQDKLHLPEEIVDLIEFDIDGKKIRIDDKVDPEFAKEITEMLQNASPEMDILHRNQNMNIIKGGIENNQGKLGNIAEAHRDGNVVIYQNPATQKNMSWIDKAVKHEAGHLIDENARPVYEALKGDLDAVEDMGKVVNLVNDISVKTGSGEVTEEMLREGFVSGYAYKFFKEGNVEKAVQENFAEMASLIFNDDPLVRQEMQKAFSGATEMYYDAIYNLEPKDIDKFIPQAKINTQDDIKEKISALRDMVVDIYNDASKFGEVRSPKDLQEAITSMEKSISETERLLSDNDALSRWIDKTYGDKVPKMIETEEVIREVISRKKSTDSLPDNLREIAETIRKDLIDMGMKEGIIDDIDDEFIHSYVYHMLSKDVKLDAGQIRKIRDAGMDFLIDDAPFNIHTKSRNMQGTVDEINAWAKKELGVDKFFETQITRTYLQRAINHEKAMFEQEVFDGFLNVFGQEIKPYSFFKSPDDLDPINFVDKLSKELGMEINYKAKDPLFELRNAYFNDVKSKLASGEFVLVNKDPRWSKEKVNIVFDEAMGKNQKLSDIVNIDVRSPYVAISKDNLTKETVFRGNDAGGFLVPAEAWKSYEKTMNKQSEKMSNVLLDAVDYITGIFRANATGANPRFHRNNFVSNWLQSYLGVGTKFIDPAIQTDAFKVLAGKGKVGKMNASELLDICKEYGVVDTGYLGKEVQSFLEGNADDIISGRAMRKGILNPLSRNFGLYQAGNKVGSVIENQARIVNFLIHVEDGKSYYEAADLVNKFLFDYSDLTKFEQSVMTRIVPFYTWLRKNVPLQVEQVLEQPFKYGKLNTIKNLNAVPETDEQILYRPEFLDDAVHVGDGNYKNFDLPLDDLQRVTSPREMFGSINPLLKLPFELGTNTNVYFDSPIKQDEYHTVEPPLYLRPFAEDTEDGKRIDPRVPYAIKNLVPGLDSISNLAEYLQEVISDVPEEERDKYKEDKALGWLTGGRTFNVDTETEKRKALYKYLEDLKKQEEHARKTRKLYNSKTGNPLIDAFR